MAASLLAQPDGRRHRRLPLVPSSWRESDLLAWLLGEPRRRRFLPVVRHSSVSQDGKKLRRPDLKMSDIVVTVENLSKRYLVGHRSGERERYTALRDVIAREARNFIRKASDAFRGRQIIQGDEVEEFWALKNVSFDVKHGDVLGIIGRNGAGKSTVLKILSRITEPTSGLVRLRGRVASLLEVGTGFHPELTGRENIFLNGAILGMSRSEIRSKFDEIVAFAEVEKFLDTPVKRYSSGMYVRLAFAVAAHLDAEILVIDEVLAVGDAEFQRKCFGKMDEVSRREGRTVLFVSHNLGAVAEMTHRSLLLEEGRVASLGPSSEVITKYFSKRTTQPNYMRHSADDNLRPYVTRAEITTSDPNGIHRFGEPLEIRFLIRHDRPIPKACFSFQILNQMHQPVIHAFAYHPSINFAAFPGESILICRFPTLRLNVGHFELRTFLSEPPGGALYETLDSICPFEVIRVDKTVQWGWRPEACAYHEEFSWKVSTPE